MRERDGETERQRDRKRACGSEVVCPRARAAASRADAGCRRVWAEAKVADIPLCVRESERGRLPGRARERERQTEGGGEREGEREGARERGRERGPAPSQCTCALPGSNPLGLTDFVRPGALER